jgi:hypothetical protein
LSVALWVTAHGEFGERDRQLPRRRQLDGHLVVAALNVLDQGMPFDDDSDAALSRQHAQLRTYQTSPHVTDPLMDQPEPTVPTWVNAAMLGLATW